MNISSPRKPAKSTSLPADWDFIEIGDHIDLVTGFPFPSNGYSSDGVRLLRGSNVKRGELDWDPDITAYWPSNSTALAKFELDAGDLVVAMDGSLVGRSYARLTKEDIPALLLQRVARIRSTKLHVGYLTQNVGSELFVKYVDSVKTVTAIPHISPSDIRQFKIAVPSTVEEQAKISNALNDIDDLIASLDALIAKKRDIKQAAMQQLLTGKTRLPGFEGEWEVAKLGEIAKIQRGASPRPIDSPRWFDDNSTIGWVRISDVTRSGMKLTETTQRLSAAGVQHSRFVTKGSLIMSICATIGRPIISSLNVCIHDGFVVFDDLKVEKDFLYFVLKSIEGEWSKMGQTGSQMNLNTGMINGKEISVPVDRAEQNAIAKIALDSENEIVVLQDKVRKARNLKQGMMQQLLTGRIRLV